MMKNSIKYLIVTVLTFIVGYVYLKTAYLSTQDFPFVNEIVLIILGTIATIAITAALLNKQSEIELEKEQRVKIFDLKSSLYFELINFIEGVIVKSEITENDMIHLQYLTHKISIIASLEVLKEYTNFVTIVKKVSLDANVSRLESKELSLELNKLCSKIRYDLIVEEDNNEFDFNSLVETKKN